VAPVEVEVLAHDRQEVVVQAAAHKGPLDEVAQEVGSTPAAQDAVHMWARPDHRGTAREYKEPYAEGHHARWIVVAGFRATAEPE
jgi:hypothetical protein